MDARNSEIESGIQQIKKFAIENSIGYNTVIDILADENPSRKEEEIDKIISELVADGINILPMEDPEDTLDANDDPESFVPANVQISQRPMTIWNLMERLKYNEFDLQPDFQRNRNLWNAEQKSQLIESLMLKIPLPAFYFDASCDEKWKVIDGLQRLSAFQQFLVGTVSQPASADAPQPLDDQQEQVNNRNLQPFQGLQYLKEFNGLTFAQLPRQYIRRIQESQIVAYTVEKGTPDAVVFNIFRRINTGGLKLTEQEIRHALYPGKATKLTEELAVCDEFRNVIKDAIYTGRMLDLEYVNRFIAFTELDYKKVYKDDINSFLNKAMKIANGYSDEKLDQIRVNFKRIMQWSLSLFGKFAFRRYSASWRRSPINKSMFELWSICLNDMSEEDVNRLVERREDFLEAFKDLQQTADFKASFDSTKSVALNRRIQLTKKFLEEFLCCNP